MLDLLELKEVSELAAFSQRELWMLPYIGRVTLGQIKRRLAAKKLALHPGGRETHPAIRAAFERQREAEKFRDAKREAQRGRNSARISASASIRCSG